MFFIIYIFIFIFGLIIGSFLNCLIWRLYKKIPLTPFIKGAFNRSYCPKCGKMIVWYDNIPVLSFILLGGKCRSCKKQISRQYPVVELATGVLFVVTVICNLKFEIWGDFDYLFQITNYQLLITILRDWFLISVMIVIFVIDLRWYLILDIVALPAAAVVFVLNLLLGFSWQSLLISGIIGSSFFLIQFIVSRGKWIGGGDIRLGLLMGLALGWPNVIIAIFLAYFIGSFIGIGLILAKKKEWGSKVPMGTFLAISTIIIIFWGDGILNWYLGLFYSQGI